MRSVLIQLADDARPRKRKEEARINGAMVVVGFWEKNKEKGRRRGERGEKEEGEDSRVDAGDKRWPPTRILSTLI